MPTKIELTFPLDLYQEIKAYSESECESVNEFILWVVSEKVGELRQRRGVKNLSLLLSAAKELPRLTVEAPLDKVVEKEPKTLLRAEEAAKF